LGPARAFRGILVGMAHPQEGWNVAHGVLVPPFVLEVPSRDARALRLGKACPDRAERAAAPLVPLGCLRRGRPSLCCFSSL
jgi:hypothetical protein